MTKIIDNIDLGFKWLKGSGVQNLVRQEDLGGFSAWYDADKGSMSFTYTEITGYALNLLVAYQKKYPTLDLDTLIKQASDYLTELAFDPEFGAVMCRYVEPEGWVKKHCTFDNGIVANGLINRHRYDGDERSLEVALKVLDTIMEKLYFGDGFYARWIEKESRFQNDPGKWSTGDGPFFGKIAIPYFNAYDVTKEEKYLEFGKRTLDLCLRFQQDDGRFITCSENKTTFLHPHLYTTEGLLVGGLYLEDKKYLEAVDRSLEWVLSIQNPDGGFPSFFHSSKVNLDSPDINSQFLRCLVLSGKWSKEKALDSGLLKKIISTQVEPAGNIDLDGGFRIGDIWFFDQVKMEQGDVKNHINTWAALFVLNALYYLEYEDKNPFTMC